MSTGIRSEPRVARRTFVATAIIAIYVGWNLIAWAGQPASETFDSYRYLGDWGLNFTAIFDPLNGGVATSLLYAVTPDPTLISLMQVLISSVVWSLLALAILHRLTGSWLGWVLTIATLAISMQSVFWSSHFAIGAESLVFSAAVAWLTSIVWLTSQSAPATSGVIATIAGMACIAATRPQAMLALIPIQIVIWIWWSRREHHLKTLNYALPALVPLAMYALFRVWQISQHDRWPFRYALHNLVDKEPSFRAYVLERMPSCEAIPAALNGPAPWTDVLALDNSMISQCPDTYLWFQSGATSVWNWVPAVPFAAIRNFLDVAPDFTLIRWNELTAWQTNLDGLLIPSSNPWLFAILSLVAGIGLALAAGIRPRMTWSGALGVAVIVLCVIGYVFIVWAADGVDHGRHVFPVLPLVGVAALIFPGVISFTPSGRKRPRV